MYITHKMMEKLITQKSKQMNLEELVWQYQQTKSPVYFATAFHKLYNLITKVRVDNLALNEADIVSITLDRLDVCMTKFNGTGKFATYFANCLYRKLESLAKLARNQQRKQEDSVEDISLYETIYENVEQSLYDLNQSLDSLNLSINEQMFLGLLLQGYNKLEIAKIFKISRKHLYRQLDNLKSVKLHEALTV